MFEKLKLKMAHYYIRKKYLKPVGESFSYNNIISKSKDFFVLMPNDDKDFYHGLELIKYLRINNKNVTLFLPEHKYNLIPEKEKFRYISYHEDQKSRLNLPAKNLVQRLKSKEYEVVVDLNRNEDVYFSSITNIVSSRFRIGFNKERSENYYNLQIVNSAGDPELIYRNFVNFLRMF
ncbi:MAG TPA: hypothetical protein PLZ15_12595 [Melioribacteraceae bacterium]|mgnify:CR=1 FL=1|nr:hypothetical protein [Melioribacteraceae bacterium]